MTDPVDNSSQGMGQAGGVKVEGEVTEPPRTIPTTCIEHQVGRPTVRLSFQIKVF